MQNINLNILPTEYPPVINCSQGDSGRDFRVILEFDDDFEIPEGASITLAGTKPSGLGFTVTGTLQDEDEVLFSTTPEMTDESGYIACEVRIRKDDLIIGTTNAALMVEPTPHPDDVVDDTAEHLVDTIHLLVDRAEDAAQRAEDAADRAEHAGGGGGGISPTAKVVKVGDTATITITDKDGTTTASVKDGKDGKDGVDGSPGLPGADGKDGVDGFSPSISAQRSGGVVNITITDATHTEVTTIADGEDGAPGTPGAAGFSPIASVSKSGSTTTLTVTDQNGTTTATINDGQDGTPGATGPAGPAGYTPVKGTDYWTAQDKADIVEDVLAEMINAEQEAM